jgi:flagellar motor switch protein FliM
MVDDVLDQDEIDALLGANVEQEAPETEKVAVQAYDFANQERIIRGRLPALDVINERFCREFQRNLNQMLRTTAEVHMGGVRMTKMFDYLRGLHFPTSLNIVRINPLRGAALFVISAPFIFTSIGKYFGGDISRRFKIEGREFTAIEQRYIRKILDLINTDLEKAWNPVIPVKIEYVHSEMNPKFANIVSPTDLVVVNTIRVVFDGKETIIEFVLPYAMLEPKRKELEESVQAMAGDDDSRWMNILGEEVRNVDLTMSVELAKTSMTAYEVVKLKPGDIIPIEIKSLLTVRAQGQALFKASYGRHNGKNAVKIQEALKHPAYINDDLKNKNRVHL